MFLLICPNCEHETRCKYARSGAVASCPSCRSRFDLNEYTLKVERQTEDLFAPWKASTPQATVASATEGAPELIQELSAASAPTRSKARPKRRRRRIDATIVSLNFAAVLIVGVAIWWSLRSAGVVPGPAMTEAAPRENEPSAATQPAPDPTPRGEALPRVTFTQ